MSAERDDDDLEGGEQLKQLRSVWVSMRESDEDPPDRGLSALMAAARTKAAEMTPAPTESWWQKVLAVFRRPPVLALATVTVLLGGALFITQRGDSMKSESTADERRPDLEVRAREPVAAGSPAAGAPAPVDSAIATPPTIATESTPPGENAAELKPLAKESPRPVKKERPAKIATKGESSGTANSSPTTPELEHGLVDEAPMVGGTIKQVTPDSLGAVTPTSPPPVAEPTTRGPTTKRPTATTNADTGESATVSDEKTRVASLIKQCETAAARGDCAAVRSLAGRIKSDDVNAYNQRVLKNASIARCLDTPAIAK